MVEVKNLTKKYSGHTAVDDISFTLLPGKIYGLLGPNGAGKSTTMNMMTGYIAPGGGTVEVDGHDIYKDGKAARSRIGYLPENPPLYQDMTVHEYLVFVAELKGMDKSQRLVAVEAVMEDAGVLDVADKLIRSLSKGYRQRVGFAVAIINDPAVVILDEPTVGLDPKQILEFRDRIRSLGEEHIVLLSSHILSEISAVCDHVFIINKGKLIVDDDVSNLDKYVNSDRRITISVKSSEEDVVLVLGDLEGIKDVFCGEEKDGVLELDITAAADNSDITEQISLALMEHRIPILGMKEEKGSLEQIFLEITQEDPAAAEEAESETETGESEEETNESETETEESEEETNESETKTEESEEEAGEESDKGDDEVTEEEK